MAVSASVILLFGCSKRAEPGDGSPKTGGEPEQYSATVVRTIEDGTSRETVVSREARAGEQRREEWTENDRQRALIWRPDIGKAYLLDLDARSFVEIDIGATLTEPRSGPAGQHSVSSENIEQRQVEDNAIQAIDQYFTEKQLPTRVETQQLSPAMIEGYQCVVEQQKAFFPDGHAETTKRFQARDLSGLLLRVESEADQGRTRVITERRDIRIGVAPDTFTVPVGFKKVESLISP